MMKNLKKLLALLLALAMLLSLAACSGSESDDDTEEDTEATEEAGAASEIKTLIEKGEYEKAYDKLIALENPTAEEEALLEGFRFMPTKVTYGTDVLEYTYNDDGLPTSMYMTEDGEWMKAEITYNADGKIAQVKESSNDAGGYNYTTTYAYDDKGNKVSENNTGTDGETSTTTYTYDQNGNLLSESYTGSDG